MTHKRWRQTVFLLILTVYAVLGGLYATTTPAWQAPDEPAHYNYVRQLAAGRVPVMQMGDWDNAYIEELRDRQFPPALTDDGQLDAVQYEDHQPPLYYALAAGVYRLSDGRLTAIRAFSLLLGALVVVGTYAVGRRLLPARPGAALSAAALVAVIPQHLAILGSVTNDALAYALVAVTLWTCAAYLATKTEGRLWRWHLALGALVGLALLTKVTVYFLAGVVVLALILRPLTTFAARPAGRVTRQALSIAGAVRKAIPRQDRPPAMQKNVKRNLLSSARNVYMPVIRRSAGTVTRRAAWVLLIGLVVGALWWARNSVVYGFPDVMALERHDAVVVGQLRTSERLTEVGWGTYLQQATRTTFNSFWGQLGWMARPLPGWAYDGIGALLWFAVAGLIIDVVRLVRAKRPPTVYQLSLGLLLFFTGLMASAAYIYYNVSFYQVQGRYLFTALIPFALWVGAGVDVWARLAAQWRPLRPVTDYLPALVILAAFGALNLWLLRFIVPTLAPIG